MKETEIIEHLGQAIAAAVPTLGVVWENQNALPKRPYAFVQFVPVAKTGLVLDLPDSVNEGYALVTIVSEIGEFATPALAQCELIVDALPKGHKIDTPNGCIYIPVPPVILPAFRDGPDWRTPVRVNYKGAQ